MTAYQGPELLSNHHDIAGFDCGVEVLNQWLQRWALKNQKDGSSRIWVVTTGGRVVAFYASSAAAIARTLTTNRVARNQPDPLPALLLGRLAVDVSFQKQGLASALVKHFLLKVIEVSEHTGVRIALVHAKDAEAASFYQNLGFVASPVDELTLMVLVKDIVGL